MEIEDFQKHCTFKPDIFNYDDIRNDEIEQPLKKKKFSRPNSSKPYQDYRPPI